MRLLKSHRWLVPLVLVLAGGLFAARSTDLYQLIENKTLDWRFRRFSDASKADPSIVLAMLDQDSLDFGEKDGNHWPWPRSLYIPILELAKTAGAKLVVFDVIFSGPSSLGADQDQEFAAAIKRHGRVLLAVDMSERGAPEGSDRATPPPDRFAVATEGDAKAVSALKRSTKLPIPELREAAWGLGDVSAPPDADGVFRRLPLLSEMGDRTYPLLAVAAAMKASGVDKLRVDKDAAWLGGRRVPLADGRLLLNFHGSALDERIHEGRPAYASFGVDELISSFIKLQEGGKPEVDPAALKDKIVLVGLSAPGLMDLRPSPLAPVFPGTEILAVALDNLLNGDPLVPAGDAAAAAAILLAAIAGAAAALVHWRLGASLGLLAALSAALLGAAVAAFKAGYQLDVVAPQLGLLLAFAASSAYSYVVEGRSKRYIKGAFALYLSPEVVDQIADSPEKLKLAGERREISLFFSDIEGFTTLSESLTPERLSVVMNRYLSAMTDIILESGGTLDKYIGDAIMAFWNAPLDCPDHAVRACRSALLNQAKMNELRKQFEAEGLPPLRVRIGLNSGMASVGNMGSTRRFSYTAMGDEVNLASRLEGSNKAYGTFIMLSENTRRLAGDAVEVRELDFIKVKGKNKPMRVYELLGMRGEVDPARRERAQRYELGLAAYRDRDWDRAEKAFLSLDDDEPSKVFLGRIDHFRHEPPPADWDGSYALKEK